MLLLSYYSDLSHFIDRALASPFELSEPACLLVVHPCLQVSKICEIISVDLSDGGIESDHHGGHCHLELLELSHQLFFEFTFVSIVVLEACSTKSALS